VKTMNTASSRLSFAGFIPRVEPLKWKRILVPLDFSTSSAKALNYAMPLALQAGGKLVLLHVVQFPVMPMPVVTGGGLGEVRQAHKTLRQAAKASLDALAKEAQKTMPGIMTHKAVTAGVAWDEIVKAAKRLACDLVVLSTHGHTGVLRMLANHTAEHVVRMAPCPVLCVRG
jgi:universal stress protein A